MYTSWIKPNYWTAARSTFFFFFNHFQASFFIFSMFCENKDMIWYDIWYDMINCTVSIATHLPFLHRSSWWHQWPRGRHPSLQKRQSHLSARWVGARWSLLLFWPSGPWWTCCLVHRWMDGTCEGCSIAQTPSWPGGKKLDINKLNTIQAHI